MFIPGVNPIALLNHTKVINRMKKKWRAIIFWITAAGVEKSSAIIVTEKSSCDEATKVCSWLTQKKSYTE